MAKKKGSVSAFRGKYRAYLGRKYLGVFENEIDAWKEIDGCREALANRDKIRDTLRLVGERWFDDRDKRRTVKDVSKERSVWRTHIETAKFIDYPVKAIRSTHVAKWLDELTEKKAIKITRNGRKDVTRKTINRKIGLSTVRRAKTLLNGALKFALKEGLIVSNPMIGVETPKPAYDSPEKSAKRIEFLTLAEIDRVFALDLTEEQRAIFTVAIYTGLRMGEIWGLRWENVQLDGDRPHIKVEHSYNGPPKSKASFRTVPLFRTPREALRRWKTANGAIRGFGLVFPSRHGGCYCKGHSAKWFDKRRGSQIDKGIRSRAKIDRDVHFHDLRHTFASHLVMGDWGRVWNLYEVKEVLGHTSISVTERYAHLSPDSIAKAAREMDI